ncbi:MULTISPECIES: hypothetical protein [unclassified Streptomyces]|uniref:hypothetical protein n=1 Tax=unclassified Streptomyces TaxID=2593676 RepID=UPI00093E7AB1|nr:hypothetical protein [Streptomyces sp. TSRI0281]OKI35178.1 hypothetical protein A6A29_16660 [Streptomyces sp. TSRI0281]
MTAPLIANADTFRVTRVNGCGRPVCGEDNAYVTDCFASLAMNANIEEGEDTSFKGANGRQCGYKKGCPTLNGYDIELVFYQASPELIEIMTGSPVFYDHAGRPIGWDDCSIACRAGFALELWADILGEDVCPEEETAEGAWQYFLMPWVTNGIIGDLELGSEGVNFTLTGSTRAGGKWGVGPYDVMAQDAAGTPGPMLTPLGQNCHRRPFITTIAPPEPSTEYLPVEGDLCLAS